MTDTGLIVPNLKLIGADGAVHMAEETHNAAVAVPWNMIITIFFNGLLGFGMLLTALFCMGDLESAMETTMHYPFIQIIYNSTSWHYRYGVNYSCAFLCGYLWSIRGSVSTTVGIRERSWPALLEVAFDCGWYLTSNFISKN